MSQRARQADGRQQAAAALAAAGSGGAPAPDGPPPARAGSYRPPNASMRAKHRVAPAYTADRFEKEVLGGRLWHAPCQEASHDISEQIPLSFPSMDDYVCTFEPLVLEEAREGLKADWAESCAAGGRGWAVEVASVEETADGWCMLRVRALAGHGDMKRACQPNSVAVLTDGRPPPRGAIEWVQAQVAGSGGRGAKRQRLDAVAAAAAAAADAEGPAASVDSSGGNGGQDGDEAADSSAAAAGAGAGWASSRVGTPGPGEAPAVAGRVVAGMVRRGKEDELVMQIHPACAAHAHDRAACCWAAVAALQRSAAAAGGAAKRWWLVPARSLISSQREFDAVHRVRAIERSLLRFLLRPQLLAPIGEYYDNPEVRRSLWPEQAAQPAFIDYLRQRYDETQLEAIEMAACHLGAPDSADGGGGHPLLPFVLIQGPPGTGKTHTTKGMLNVWHLVAYQRYCDGLIAATTPPAAAALSGGAAAAAAARRQQLADLNAAGTNILDVVSSSMLSHLGRAVAQTKPRILVCTPSNAACDELLTRVMTEGFADGSGRVYRPNVVRVGSEQGGVNAAVRDRLVGLMVDRYRTMSQGDWQRRFADLQQRHSHVSRELEALEVSLGRAAQAATAAAAAAAPAGEQAAAQQQHMELAKKLVDRAQAAARFQQELERLQLARDLVWGRQGQEWRLREAEQSIEASFLYEAEMVFTTLSSTQRKVFQQSASKAPFHTVLIDEAGQSSEVAALQPLVFGAKRVFPSAHFYGGRLRDAESIRDMPPAPFYAHPLMKPYVFFDVAKGKELRREGGGSLSNRAEALLAACLFAELRSFLIERAQQQPGSITGPTSDSHPAAMLPLPEVSAVGVITPYREQRKLLREMFEEVCGKGPASEVFIETVDSFQGKQLDVVILSCVRASVGGGLGFVNDIRRMNVAITRAKRSLWVLGASATLRANREWAALIGDAEERGLVIADAEAQDLFPGLSYWQRQQEQQQQQGEGGEGRAAQPQGRREGSAPAPAPAGASAGAGAGLAGLPPLSRVPPSGRASAEVQPLMSPAAAAAMQSLQPQPQPPQPRPMLSLQQQQQQQQQPIPMQRAAEQQLRPAGPTAAPGVRPMQRLHAGQQQQQQQQPGAQARPPAAPSAYPSLPTRRQLSYSLSSVSKLRNNDAAVVWCASLAQPRLLAGSLGFAAGVMLYVSFAEIFMRKSVAAFEAVTADGNTAYRWSTLCFFGGMVLVFILDRIVHLIAHWGVKRSMRKAAAAAGGAASASTTNLLTHEDQRNARPPASTPPAVAVMRKGRRAGAAGAAAAAAAADLEAGGSASGSPRKGAGAGPGEGEDAQGDGSERGGCERGGGRDVDGDDCSVSTHMGDLSAPMPGLTEPCDAMTSAVVAASCPDTVAATADGQRGGAGEGEVVTGAGTSSRTPPAVVEIMEADHHSFMLKKMGVLTALALFIHNFPGMMVYISIKELIPTALRYDPKDSLATSCVVAGMVVMAASLLLFTI
ncbi:expressed protein [Chlorella variabilis]|uniref:Expressed protein n=1 Tax=Chlorella variabilis TaxID=554065 RepID=E1ZK21_CHLVA|nr:expressed protein [Chlorella variabilis]EFN53619.1 expressed protein [Chlorella variabilis]|eukprot:XP_005845721.1 expressed protein [Chlorella variabilis]